MAIPEFEQQWVVRDDFARLGRAAAVNRVAAVVEVGCLRHRLGEMFLAYALVVEAAIFSTIACVHHMLGGQLHVIAILIGHVCCDRRNGCRSEEHTSELQSLMRISYAVFCLKKK